MWISFTLCIYAGSKNSWKFYKDNLVDDPGGWYGSQKREAKYFSAYFCQPLVSFFSDSNK